MKFLFCKEKGEKGEKRKMRICKSGYRDAGKLGDSIYTPFSGKLSLLKNPQFSGSNHLLK